MRKAVKWSSPFYGIDGRGWLLSFHCFTKYDPLDDAQLAAWVKQASQLPGWARPNRVIGLKET